MALPLSSWSDVVLVGLVAARLRGRRTTRWSRASPSAKGVRRFPRGGLLDGRAVGEQAVDLGALGTQALLLRADLDLDAHEFGDELDGVATEISLPEPALKVRPTTWSSGASRTAWKAGGVEDEVEVARRGHRAESDLAPARASWLMTVGMTARADWRGP